MTIAKSGRPCGTSWPSPQAASVLIHATADQGPTSAVKLIQAVGVGGEEQNRMGKLEGLRQGSIGSSGACQYAIPLPYLDPLTQVHAGLCQL